MQQLGPSMHTQQRAQLLFACACRGGVNIHRWLGVNQTDSAPFKGLSDGLFAKKVTHYLVS